MKLFISAVALALVASLAHAVFVLPDQITVAGRVDGDGILRTDVVQDGIESNYATILATFTAPTLRANGAAINPLDLSYEIEINGVPFTVASSPATIQTAVFCPCTARIRAVAGVPGAWSSTVQVQ